ncbi:MAG: hypothetical protein RH862_00055 [Leptospiraceae bacterium]
MIKDSAPQVVFHFLQSQRNAENGSQRLGHAVRLKCWKCEAKPLPGFHKLHFCSANPTAWTGGRLHCHPGPEGASIAMVGRINMIRAMYLHDLQIFCDVVCSRVEEWMNAGYVRKWAPSSIADLLIEYSFD